MVSWYKYPFIRLLVPFISGIISSFGLKIIDATEEVVIVLLISLCILLFLLFIITLTIRSYRYRWIFSILLNIFLLLLGFSFVKVNDFKIDVNNIADEAFPPNYYLARLSDCPVVNDKTVKVMIKLIGIECDTNLFVANNSMIMAYFEKDEKALSLGYGDCILFRANPKLVEKPPNPEQFNYKDYLYKKGVAYQVYLRDDAWIDINHNKSNPIYSFSYSLRDFLLRTMKNLGIKEDEYSVAAAILLGYDDSLEYELRQKYVAAGAMHILCVSGLHVGVVFMVFSYILAFLNDRKKWQHVIKHIILLLLIWFYALLAGLAPSILRATIMLSFVIIGNIINRKGIMLNSIAASAFILLCVNPSNIYDVGFQLSYVAVIGIVVLQAPIYKIVYSKYRVVNKIWEITSVTIAAQIATSPFTIYYFHQFPIYFWLSNLFMTPISSVVIIGGMIMLLVFFIPYINVAVAWIVSKMIFVMNYGVNWIESLPYSIVKGLYISDYQFVILLFMLLLVLFLVEHKKNRLLIPLMMMSCIFIILEIYHDMDRNNQKEMVIYSINNMTAIDFIYGKEHLILSDTAFLNDKSAFSYNIENFLIKKGLFYGGRTRLLHEDFDESFVKKRKSVVTFDKKLIGLSDGSVFSKKELLYKIPLDYMIVYGRKRQRLSALLNIYTFDYLIIDGSVPYYLLSDLKREADELGIKYHDIRENGAFLIK